MNALQSLARRTCTLPLLALALSVPWQIATAVDIEQSPLIIQQALPPNLVLMLDDSGSMAWDYMPDDNYLTDPVNGNGNPSEDDYRAYNVNGTYYNPSVTYSRPPHADSTQTSPNYYPAGTFPNAYVDGFNTGSGTKNVTSYNGPNYPYYYNLCYTITSGSCPSFTTRVTYSTQNDSHGQRLCQGSQAYSSSHTTCSLPVFTFNGGTATFSLACPNHSQWEESISACWTARTPSSLTCPRNYNLNGGQCTRRKRDGTILTTDPTYSCRRGYDTISSDKQTCYDTTPQVSTATSNYTRYYVADNLTDDSSHQTAATAACSANGPNCYLASDTSGAVSPATIQAGQNIANWFTYYHTRILMAKSGLMSAFSGLDSTFRVGFGSIDANNTSGIPSASYAFSTQYQTHSNKLAQVQPFGDGGTSTQKAKFWSWLAGESASGGTPLRQALNAVGSYYQTDQPWETSSSDSTKYACRQSFTILTTDGFWNESSSCYSSDCIGNADGTDATSDITGTNGQTYSYLAEDPYQDDYDDTLADVAMHYWQNDLKTGMANDVPTSSEDPAFWQHMSTFAIGLGFQPIDTGGQTLTWNASGNCVAHASSPAQCIDGFVWPQPSGSNGNDASIFNITDMLHAAVDSHGGFYSAKNPHEFSDAVQNALAKATTRSGTGASLAANSATLSTGATVFQAFYHTVSWWGDLKASPLTNNTISSVPSWSSASLLPNTAAAAAARNVWTSNSGSAVAFTAANAGAAPMSGHLSANLINYLRGDNTQEGATYRTRTTALGDIVNSQPVYVGAPNINNFYGQTFTGSSAYSGFASTEADRTPMMYVAANDGMLHAFNATTGSEVYAYIPAAVITRGSLDTLANTSYGDVTNTVPHQFFNDGEMSIADIYDTTSTEWRTILVGTTGRGAAKAVYALDITDPANIGFLWERSAGDGKANSNYIGQMVGQPLIIQTAEGTWSVLIGNGYNSAANVAALLQFDALTGDLSVHTVADSTIGNGLAAPESWISTLSSGISDIAYAGDLRGQVWSFSLASSTSTGTLLFTAKDSSGNRQPITAGMLAGEDGSTGNRWIFFGTGAHLNQSDLGNTSTQTWYGIIVHSSATSLVTNLSNGRGSLKQRKILYQQDAQTVTNTDGTTTSLLGQRAFTPTPTASDMAGKSGWYMDLLPPSGIQQGERMVLPNQFQGSVLIGTTKIPKATDVCNPTGQGWIMALNPFSGTNISSEFFDFSPAQGNTVQVTDNGVTTTVPVSGVGTSSVPNAPIFVGNQMLVSYDNGTATSMTTHATAGNLKRVSWHQITN